MAQPSHPATQHFLNIADIRDDVMILRNGELRQVLQVTAFNFALKSEEEQAAIIYQYQAFLNSLQFPIQILIQSRQLDLTRYLTNLQGLLSKTSSPLMRNQIADYIEFVSRLISLGNIMEKHFYTIIPLATPAIRARSLFGQILRRETVRINDKDLASAKIKMAERVDTIRSGLGSLGLGASLLGTEQLKQLLYNTYNPVEAQATESDKIGEPSVTH